MIRGQNIIKGRKIARLATKLATRLAFFSYVLDCAEKSGHAYGYVRVVFIILAIAGFFGCLFWIHQNPEEVEHYVETVTAVGSLILAYKSEPKRLSNLFPQFVHRHDLFVAVDPSNNYRPSGRRDFLTIHNDGDAPIIAFAIKFLPRPRQPALFLHDCKELGLLEFPRIFPGKDFESEVTISHDSGTEFDFEWNWIERGEKRHGRGSAHC